MKKSYIKPSLRTEYFNVENIMSTVTVSSMNEFEQFTLGVGGSAINKKITVDKTLGSIQWSEFNQ